jgi:hypothetical protein
MLLGGKPGFHEKGKVWNPAKMTLASQKVPRWILLKSFWKGRVKESSKAGFRSPGSGIPLLRNPSDFESRDSDDLGEAKGSPE